MSRGSFISLSPSLFLFSSLTVSTVSSPSTINASLITEIEAQESLLKHSLGDYKAIKEYYKLLLGVFEEL